MYALSAVSINALKLSFAYFEKKIIEEILDFEALAILDHSAMRRLIFKNVPVGDKMLYF